MSPAQPPDRTGHPFWDYSLAVYGRPGVAAACLALQESRDADVNILLYCCWRAACGDAPLDRAALAQLVSRVASWQDTVIRTLRGVRVRTKGEFSRVAPERLSTFRDSLKALELDAEHIEQMMLAEHATAAGGATKPDSDGAPVAAASLAAYLSLLERDSGPDTQAVANLAKMLAGAFADLN